MRLMPPEYYPIPGYSTIWSEDEEINSLSQNEISKFLEIAEDFPIHSDINYQSTVIEGIEKSGTGRIIGYCLRVPTDIFCPSYFYLFVMSRNGLEKINQADAELVINQKDDSLCSTTAMEM